MRIPSGTTDRYIYFVAVDATDLKTRETALGSFSVYYEIANGVATAMTTPTVTESDATNMPGVYSLLIDESGMTTLTAGHDTAELCLHITQASMAPVTRVIEIYRVKITEGQAVTAANSAIDADIERLQGNAIATPTVAGVLEVDVTHILGTAVSTPATAGILDVNVKNIDNDAASASGTVTFPNATLASTTNITAGTVTTATNVTTVNGLAANVITAAATAGDFTTEIQAGLATAAALQTVDDLVDDLESRIGTPTDLGGGATLSANLVVIEGQTDDIGVAGAGLTNINLPDQTMNITGDITGNLSGSVGSVTGAVGSVTGLTVANLDVAVSTRLATAGYTAPDNAGILAAVGDVPTNAELATALGAADDAVLAQVALVKAKTDSLTFTVAGQVDANVQSVNDVTIIGNGAGTPFQV